MGPVAREMSDTDRQQREPLPSEPRSSHCRIPERKSQQKCSLSSGPGFKDWLLRANCPSKQAHGNADPCFHVPVSASTAERYENFKAIRLVK